MRCNLLYKTEKQENMKQKPSIVLQQLHFGQANNVIISG